jgi:polysaccharide biosynthesis transport protein
MTSLPANRMPQAASRPAQPGGAAAGGLGLAPIDPIRILKQYKWWLIFSVIIGLMLGFAAHHAIRYFYPLWRAEVVYQCLPPGQDPTRQAYPVQDKDEMERFLLTTATVINSDRIIRTALVDSAAVFERDTEWGRRETLDATGRVDLSKAIRRLKRVASANVQTGTSLIRLTVTTQNADDSAAIARAIHDAFWKDWRTLSANVSQESLFPLQQEATALERQLSTIESNKERLLISERIDDIGTVRGGLNDNEIEQATGALTRISELISRTEVQLRTYQTAASAGVDNVNYPDEIRDLVERDNVVVSLKSQLSSLRAEFEGLDKLGDNHPAKISARFRKEALERELEETRQGQLRKLFNAEMQRLTNTLESAKKDQVDQQQRLATAVSRKQDMTRAIKKFDELESNRIRVSEKLDETRRAITSQTLILNIVQGDRVDRIRLLTAPQAPETLFFPRYDIMLPLGVVFCLGLTAGFLFLRELLDQRIKGPSDIFSIPRIRLMGAIPSATEDPTNPAPETALRDASSGAIADAFRQTKSVLLKRMQNSGYKSLLVFSGNPESGSSTTVANLGIGVAQSEQRVLLIDANLRRPSLHKIFKLGEGPGLGEVLNRKLTMDAAVQQTSTPNLSLLSAGAAGSRTTSERLSTELMTQIISEAAGKYDLVIIDAPPATVAGDALAIANRADASLMVIRAKSEKRGLIARLRDQFGDTRSELLGVMVNGVERTAGGYMRRNIEMAREYQAGA